MALLEHNLRIHNLTVLALLVPIEDARLVNAAMQDEMNRCTSFGCFAELPR
jgi:hypothetical protein